MPRKIRQLKADLRKAGFVEQRRRGKGSHSRWFYPLLPSCFVVLAGHDGNDAKSYQEDDVRDAIKVATADRDRNRNRNGNEHE